MKVLVQQTAPDFKAMAVTKNGSFEEIQLSDYRDKYVMALFYPADFTFVCPTELIAFSDRIEEFEERHTQVLAISVDSQYAHLAWRNTPRRSGGIGDVRFPLVADLDKKISESYGVLLPEGIALRGLFLIDPEGVVRHQVINDLPLGRSVDEALRMVDALQFFEQNGEVCPANWQLGSKTMKPTPAESRAFFAEAYADIAS